MSKKVKIIVPIPMDEAGVANRASQLSSKDIRDGYEPEFVAVSWGAALGDSYHDLLLMDWTVFEAGIKAEEEGYAAVCIDTVSDSGLYALRSRLSIPVFAPGQIAYYIPAAGVAFVGDALFALGCGRLFEGDAKMMWTSLNRLKALPAETTVYCAHEYTAANARFAVSVDPANEALAAYARDVEAARARGEWTVPTVLERELAANPFLRADDPGLQAAMGHPGDAVATFAEVRQRKDNF